MAAVDAAAFFVFIICFPFSLFAIVYDADNSLEHKHRVRLAPVRFAAGRGFVYCSLCPPFAARLSRACWTASGLNLNRPLTFNAGIVPFSASSEIYAFGKLISAAKLVSEINCRFGFATNAIYNTKKSKERGWVKSG